jgi:hypothetical protein
MRVLWAPIPKPSRWGFVAALVLVLTYGIMHWAGCRDLVTILTGTVPGGVSQTTAILFGSGYVLAYLACWIVAPVLVIAAALYWLLSVVVRRRRLSRGG